LDDDDEGAVNQRSAGPHAGNESTLATFFLNRMHATCGGSKAQIHAEARAGMQDKHHQAVSIPS
jgi:hypothetical protein